MKPSDVLARRRALLTKIQTEGAEAAYAAALAVCQDAKAPAPARATCATTILRAGGYLSAREDGTPKEPHEMTASELAARLAEIQSDAVPRPSDADGGADVFG